MENSKVIAEAKKLGLDKVGFCSAKDFNQNFKSVIAAVFPYYTGKIDGANISKYCFGLDYHKVVSQTLSRLAYALGLDVFEIFCDIGKNDDRKIAQMCGLGFYGINSLIINEDYGSYFFIGYIFCNEDFEYSTPVNTVCKRCMACKNACPAGAVRGDFTVDTEKCLSNVTQKKGELQRKEITMIKENNTVFGCDICQDVCPHNKNVKKSHFDEFTKNLITKLEYDDIANLSNKEFLKKYGDRAFSWRGKKVVERNLSYIKDGKSEK